MAENPLVGVSGPSTFSKRTDVGTPEMKLGSIAYGEGKETQAIKSGAPLATTPDVTPSQAPAVSAQATPSVGLFDPSQRPEEAITTGVDIGAGAGSNALMLGKSTEKLSDTLAKLLPFDTTGEITILYQQAASRGL
jgi:hypothetical protein